MDHAACIGADPELFFPIAYGNQFNRDECCGEAIAICNTCDVRRECLDMAVDDPTLVGVWGGTTPEDRKRLRRFRYGPTRTTYPRGER